MRRCFPRSPAATQGQRSLVAAPDAGYLGTMARQDAVTDTGRAREILVDELRDAVGDEAVEHSDLDVDRALDRRPRSMRAAFMSSRLLLIVIGGALLTVGVVASLATESWIWFGVALAAHALISMVVITAAFSLVSQVEKPAPTTVTALEAEGVTDPEGALNDLVEQVSAQEPTSSAPKS
jgi:hypothetical protein